MLPYIKHFLPIFHLEINFLTVLGLTSFSGERFPFGLKLLKIFLQNGVPGESH
jgi:hypothetical protein